MSEAIPSSSAEFKDTLPEIPAVESAPATEQPNSPEQGESLPTPSPEPAVVPTVTDAPPTEPEPIATVAEPVATLPEPVPEQPAPLLAAPTIQPPLPGGVVFSGHGSPTLGDPVPRNARGTYVDKDGQRIGVEIVAQRKDGSRDILIPSTPGSYRRDGVRRKEDDAQTGDYLE